MSHPYSATPSFDGAYDPYASPGRASASSVGTWGTDCSDKSRSGHGVLSPSQRMFRPVNIPRPMSSNSSSPTWGTVDTSVPGSYHSFHGGVPSTAASTTLYGGSHASSLSSATLVNPGNVFDFGYGAAPAYYPGPAPTTYAIQIHPDLKPGSRILRVDFKFYQSSSDPYSSSSAFLPSISYMEIRFPSFSNISCRIHRMDGGPVTISTIMDHVHRFLQAHDTPGFHEPGGVRPSSAQGRHQSSNPFFSNRSSRRIDLLCGNGTTKFGGLTPSHGDNVWNLHFMA